MPVLRDADARDLMETARGLEDVVTRVRTGKFTLAHVRGGTFTISDRVMDGQEGNAFLGAFVRQLTDWPDR